MLLIITVDIAAMLPQPPVSIQPILPFSYFADFFITVLILLVIIRPRRIVDIVPVLNNCIFFLVLLPSFSSSTLSLLRATIKPVHIIVILSGPIGQGILGRLSSRGYLRSADRVTGCANSGLRKRRFWPLFLI